jgi:hypothetical protein
MKQMTDGAKEQAAVGNEKQMASTTGGGTTKSYLGFTSHSCY